MSLDLDRRKQPGRALALVARATLTRCDINDLKYPGRADKFLPLMSDWNNQVQVALYDLVALAPTIKPSQITRRPRFHSFYDIELVRVVDPATWRLAVFDRVGPKWVRTVAKLRAIPPHSRITRLIGDGSWPAIGPWGGVQLSDFLHVINADTRANYISMQCANGFLMSIDMEPGRHPQTILALDFIGAPLITQFGSQIHLRIPTKFGFENAKSIISMGVTDKWTKNYWTKQGYNLFSRSRNRSGRQSLPL
ncbi:MAG: hypothetical protein B7Z58_14860 [Acidiphilium sp. 37-64-53]|nr:MAG: hypothetical protein B7Z58_14860 [Acidiphilium sp. 37-64-53]